MDHLKDDWPYPLFLINPNDNCIVWVNDNALQWTKMSLKKIIASKISDILIFDESNKGYY